MAASKTRPAYSDHMKANLKISEMKTRKLLSQSRKTRSTVQVPKPDNKNKRNNIERKVLNSLTHLIDSKTENDYRNTLIFNVLKNKIKEHLVSSGKCYDGVECDETAKKMAAFVSDVMKETYKKQKMVKCSSSKIDSVRSKNSFDKPKVREKLRVTSDIPAARRPSKSSIAKLDKTAFKDMVAGGKSSNKENRVNVFRVQTGGDRNRIVSGKNRGDSSRPSGREKEKINSWLADVDDRTKKWSDWIKDTVSKAEASRSRLKSRQNTQEISNEWRKLRKASKTESKISSESSKESNDWQQEAFRKRGEESIQNWLLKNKLINSKSKDFSDYTVKSSSNESLYSVWSSQASSLGGESVISRLRKLAVLPNKY